MVELFGNSNYRYQAVLITLPGIKSNITIGGLPGSEQIYLLGRPVEYIGWRWGKRFLRFVMSDNG